ncbi:hypothetical protein Oweho_3246 [Owenweeksia hongkongensis DSM 17368]|uniref:Uncharacterized protein n=1 Tax=Owenweeksia hongkongensis (strain DSM 17368 / CIP 108786 / JCM 12287 / NRRL B-23963 / UST20020801) TaxID=926562 RepID=G8R497_OWEHD|nr:hypothetical protein [Owenweeksia hongkongensis]AEV34197.1 hypothetical protein Oweho_3246 [Owenweeksia hongkongensis DSM 17368]
MDALAQRVNLLYTPEQQEAELQNMGALIPEMLLITNALHCLSELGKDQSGDNPENLPISA